MFSLVNSAVSMAFAAQLYAAAPLLLGARRPPQSIDISCPHGAQQQTRRTPLLLSNDGTDGETDGHLTVTYTLLRILCGQCQKAKQADPHYHGLRGSAGPVLTATGFVNGRWQFSTPHRPSRSRRGWSQSAPNKSKMADGRHFEKTQLNRYISATV